MEFIKINNYIKHLDLLLTEEKTGTAEEFAEKLGVGERTLRNHLQQLRDLGIEIDYDHYKKTYKYKDNEKITIPFTPIQMDKLKGGCPTSSIIDMVLG